MRLVVVVTVLVACRSNAQDIGQLRAEPPAVVPSARPPSPAADPTGAGLVFIQQVEHRDCGPAAVAMTLNFYGHPTTLEATKAAMHFHSDEVSALDLVEVAKANGLGAAGVSAGAAAILSVLRPGDILHFDFDHFVVFEGIAPDGIRLLDPGMGRVTLDRARFATRFTDVALLFDRSPEALDERMRSFSLPAAR